VEVKPTIETKNVEVKQVVEDNRSAEVVAKKLVYDKDAEDLFQVKPIVVAEPPKPQ